MALVFRRLLGGKNVLVYYSHASSLPMKKQPVKRARKEVPVPRTDWAKAIKKAINYGRQEDLAKIYYHINSAALLLKDFLPKK